MNKASKGKITPKKTWPYILVIVCCLCLCAFTFMKAPQETVDQHCAVRLLLEEMSITESVIVVLGEYGDISYELLVPVVEEYEINEQINAALSENGVSELTEEFVQTALGCNSIAEFKLEIKNKLLESKKISLIIEARNSTLNTIIERSKFVLKQEEIAEFSLEIVKSYEAEAALHNMTVEQYCTDILGIAYDQFFEMCYTEGEHMIKTILVIGAIAAAEDVSYSIPSEGVDLQALYYAYQEIENAVYTIFIFADPSF